MTGPARTDEIWKNAAQARHFLTGTRQAIPLAAEQIAALLLLVEAVAPRRVLDLGCGDGILGRAILDAHPEAACRFVDFSPAMLEAAREATAAYGVRAAVAEGDMASAAWLDAVAGAAPYDAVVSGFAIHHQPDERKRALYREIHGLLAPGGLFLNLEHVSVASPWIGGLFRESFLRGLVAYHRSIGDDRPEGPSGTNGTPGRMPTSPPPRRSSAGGSGRPGIPTWTAISGSSSWPSSAAGSGRLYGGTHGGAR